MKRLYEVVFLCADKTKPLEPRKFFEKKNGPDGAKTYRAEAEKILGPNSDVKLLIIRGPDHDRFHGRAR